MNGATEHDILRQASRVLCEGGFRPAWKITKHAILMDKLRERYGVGPGISCSTDCPGSINGVHGSMSLSSAINASGCSAELTR